MCLQPVAAYTEQWFIPGKRNNEQPSLATCKPQATAPSQNVQRKLFSDCGNTSSSALPESFLSSTTSASTEIIQFLITTICASQCPLQKSSGSVCFGASAMPAHRDCSHIFFTSSHKMPVDDEDYPTRLSHPPSVLLPSLLTLLIHFPSCRQRNFSCWNLTLLWHTTLPLQLSLQQSGYFIF